MLSRLEAGGSKPDKGWQEVLRHKFFRDASNANNAGYCHALAIFLERQLSLYKVSCLYFQFKSPIFVQSAPLLPFGLEQAAQRAT